MGRKTARINARIDEELLKKVKKLAIKRHISLSTLIEAGLKQALLIDDEMNNSNVDAESI